MMVVMFKKPTKYTTDHLNQLKLQSYNSETHTGKPTCKSNEKASFAQSSHKTGHTPYHKDNDSNKRCIFVEQGQNCSSHSTDEKHFDQVS